VLSTIFYEFLGVDPGIFLPHLNTYEAGLGVKHGVELIEPEYDLIRDFEKFIDIIITGRKAGLSL
jgi:hypothetical protein